MNPPAREPFEDATATPRSSWVGRRSRRVRTPSRRGGHAPARRARPCPHPDVTHARDTERGRLAAKLDAELRAACRADATARRLLGDAARVLLARRAHARLGFVRASDYARERLGISARTLNAAAWLATRLDALPLVGTALDRSEITWSQARAICRVARSADQAIWLARSRECSAEQLDALARAGERAAPPEGPDDDREIDGEPVLHLRLRCPARVRALWRHALAFASRVAGETLPRWRAAEIIAAEAVAGRPAARSFEDRAMSMAIRLARRAQRLAAGGRPETTPSTAAPAGAAAGTDPPGQDVGALVPLPDRQSCSSASHPDEERPLSPTHPARPEGGGIPPNDAFALDARLLHAVDALRTNEPRMGRLLRLLVDHRLYRAFGHRKLDAYVRERLGISTRKAWALVAIERRVRTVPALAERYDRGDISWVRMLTLLPVVQRESAEAWLTRAGSVTVRRLVDEVNWVLEARDARGYDVVLDPPPAGSVLTPSIAVSTGATCREMSPRTRVQIGARYDQQPAEVCDTEIVLAAPATVVALLRDTMDVFGDAHEPRWVAFERILRHAIVYWESLPPHRDPVFARDGWRCTVPACSSRRNLHDHHVRYRSRGGDNARDNRTTVCAAHHLHGIHDGTIRAWGTAPDDLHWELGVRNGAPPLLRYVGDTLV